MQNATKNKISKSFEWDKDGLPKKYMKIIRMLKEDYTQRYIVKNLECSFGTISRAKKWQQKVYKINPELKEKMEKILSRKPIKSI